MADILLFPLHTHHYIPEQVKCSDHFRKALAAALILLEFDAFERFRVIDNWQERELINADEAVALHAFCRI